MSEHTDTKIDEMKGRAKEAAGALSGDDDLREDGQDDQQAADAKRHVDDAADKVKDGIDSVKDKLSGS